MRKTKRQSDVPDIRFPGFIGFWEQRKLEDIANRFDNLRVPVASSLRIKGTTPYYGANGIQDYVDGFTHEGEYVLVAEDGANDLINYPVNYVNGRIWVNNHAHVLQGKDNVVNNRYLSYAISRVNMQSVLVGGGRAKLNAEAMMNLDLFLPSIAEQKKIGECFSNLDNLITLHQRELDELKALKKCMLQKMFPKKGEKVPEIRFPGFTGSWEQRKFGDGMDLFTGFPFESEKFSDNGINLIRGMNVKRGYLDLSDNLCKKWKSSEGLEKYLLENEDILIQMDGALIGKSYAKIKESQLPALLVQRVTRARAIPEESNSDFMYQTIQRDFLKYIILNKTDSAVPHLSLNDIREFPIRVPNLEEQKKIGEYLSKLDNLITLQERKCKVLQKLKKCMLQKMFV